MKELSKKLSIAVSSLLCCNVPFVLLTTTSCSNSNAIELANYESYMSTDLMQDLQQNYSIHFPYYTVAEMIPAKFEKYYDIAIPCGYELMCLLRNGWLEKIDWAKFEVQDMDHISIQNAQDAKRLFIDAEDNYDGLEQMNKQFTTYINQIKATDPNDKLIQVLKKDNILDSQGLFIEGEFNILNYGLPYFAQSFMFAYTGSEIDFYTTGTTTKTTTPSWSDIYYTISPQNPNQDVRFRNKKVAMVDDARSFYDVSRIVESIENKEANVTNDVTKDDSQTRMFETMNHITNKFEKRSGKSFILNSDSQIVSKSLADRKGDACAIMSWSGDTIYAAQGAEEYPWFNSKEFHIMKPNLASLDEIEFMVFNNKNLNNNKKHNLIYSVAKQVCLHGCDKSETEILEKVDESEDALFKYWTMVNWDSILYTPMLKNIHRAITNKKSAYWEDTEYDDDTKDLYIDILSGSIPTGSKHLYGKTLTNLQNSNNHWAWLESRGKL